MRSPRCARAHLMSRSDRKSTRLNSSHMSISYAVLCFKKKKAAKSGHPGMPLGLADIAQVLSNDYHSHNPGNPNWTNGYPFVLSDGHASLLRYSLLQLT